MADTRRRLILANGEAFVVGVEKNSGGGTQELPRSYEEARIVVQDGIKQALSDIASLPTTKRFPDELILCLRLHPDMTAKSNEPQQLFKMVPGLDKIGSRSYTVDVHSVKPTQKLTKHIDHTSKKLVTGRLLFTRGDQQSYSKLLKILNQRESQLTREFKKDIQRIETFDLLSVQEQLLGFPNNWSEGRVEIIFHPSRNHNLQSQSDFLEPFLPDRSEIHPEIGGIRIASYPNGPTFVSCWLSRKDLQELEGANPLRAIHPLKFRAFNFLRGARSLPAPERPETVGTSTIKIGMFDGGIDPIHPLLIGHVEEDVAHSISTTVDPDLAAHGTAVAGVILYGPLNQYSSSTVLPVPAVSVVSIRALPCSSGFDPDLYEVIDVIERTVPARPDIMNYNLSFGPDGPILDDSISRFTYALDLLSVSHRVTFYVAVGNDGELPDGENRVQVPSDLVNGVGVGAFTTIGGENVPATYSCRGPGRECGKVKPELVAFGGCELSPIHLISDTYGEKILNQGTSYASPAVASMAGRLTGGFDRATPMLARALLIHSSKHPKRGPDTYIGYGIAESNFEKILGCDDNTITIAYQGQMHAKQYVKLPFLLPPGVMLPGKVTLTWTVAILPVVDPNHPSEYTVCGIEDTFYPHDGRFKFSPPIGAAGLERPQTLVDPDQSTIDDLMLLGWRQSQYPVSKSPGPFGDEEVLRESTNKWEPLVKKTVTMMGTGLSAPFLILHAIPRNDWVGSVSYAVVTTIHAPKATFDLYNRVLTTYPALLPIRLRTESEIRIRS